MSLSARRYLVLVSVLVSAYGWGQRIQFLSAGADNVKAVVQSKVLTRSADVAPVEITLTVPGIDL